MKELPLYLVRNGVPRFGQKLAQQKPVTVAYLGGSITQAYPQGYAYQLTAWLKRQFPLVPFTEVNAGIGGTGSDFGAYRLRQDVLKHKPDLMFIEFAVNDSEEQHEVQAALEGILLHTRRVLGEECEMVLLYTLARRMIPELTENRLPPASRLHEPIAEYYGLTSINMALDVTRRLNAGELKWEDFSRDECHPGPSGHTLYCSLIAEAMKKAFVEKQATRPWPDPMTKDPWDHGDIFPISPRLKFPGWTYRAMENKGGWQCFDGLLESDTPGSTAEFEFTGTNVGLFYQVGPESTDLLWSIDGSPFKPVRIMDEPAVLFWRPSYRVLTMGLAPGPHRLKVQVGVDRDPRSKGHSLRLASLLIR